MENQKIIQIIPAPAGMSIITEYADIVNQIPAVAIALVEEGGTRYLSVLGISEDGETFSSTDPNFFAIGFNGEVLGREDTL